MKWSVVITTLSLAACAIVAGIDEGVTLGVDAGAPDTGGPDEPERDSGPAAVVDASRPDTSAADADAGPSTLCLSLAADKTVVICDDFEKPSTMWTNETTGGTPVVEGDGGRDGGAGLHVLATGGTNLAVGLRIKVPGGAPNKSTSITLSFDLFTESDPGGRDYYAIATLRTLTTWDYGITSRDNLECVGGKACLEENHNGQNTFAQSLEYAAKRWYHVDLSITRAGAVYTGKITVDGTAIDPGRTLALDAANEFDLRIGVLDTSADVVPVNLRIDNIVLRRVP